MFWHPEYSPWWFIPLIAFGRYLLLAGLFFMVFYVWKKRSWRFRKIQLRFPKNADYRREIGYSALTAFIFGLMAWLCLATPLRAYTLWYTDVHLYGYGYVFVSFVLTLVLHDTYFYWTHRLMHHPKVFKYVHLVHHKSVNPSPFAAYAFHPTEALLEGLIIPILLCCVPLHRIVFFLFITFMLWFNVYGHLGYELFPRRIYRHWLGRWLNSSVYHNLHHERFRGNYGLYFSFWDKVMGTWRPDSLNKVEEVHRRMDTKAELPAHRA